MSRLQYLITGALLLSFGVVINSMSPAFFMGLKPDFMLIVLFFIIFHSDDFSTSLVFSLVAGFLSAVTSSYPGSQLPNIIDKLIVGLLAHLLISYFKNKPVWTLGIIVGLLSMVSGIIFILCVNLLSGAKFDLIRMVGVVLFPLATLNGFIFIPVYNILNKLYKVKEI